jgi:hypothetical protein
MNCECLNFNRTKIAEHYAKKGVVNPKVSETFLGINFETGQGVITLTYTIHGVEHGCLVLPLVRQVDKARGQRQSVR